MMSSTRFVLLVATFLCSLSTAAASGVIVPLYIFPGSSPGCSAWATLISTISAHRSTSFFLIVNPASGPGAPNSQPDPTSYQGCIPKLKAFSNVKVVGYVPTGAGSRAASAVNQDIATYAGWSAAFRPQGIFFDEVNPTPSLLSTYTAFAQTARSSFGNGFVILNPGSNVGSTGYFSIADQIVTSENFFSAFSSSQLSFSASSPANKQAVILHDAPSTPPSSLISQLVGSDGIGSLYITDDTESLNPYDSLPSQFATFVTEVANNS